MNSILITGATGFLGHRTIEYLLEKTDFNIVAAARTKRQERTFLSSRVIYHYGDLTQSNYVASLFDTPLFAIVNCASLSAPWGKKSDFVKANIDTQTLLIKYAKKNAVNRFIYISSPSIYVNHKDRFNIKEESILFPAINQYAATKRKAEELLRKSDLSFIILRPRALVGKGDTIIFPRLINAHKERRLKIIGNGQNICDLTAVKNVAHAINLALTIGENGINEDYNITNDKPVLLWKTINEVFDALGYDIIKKSVPLKLAYIVATIGEYTAKLGLSQGEPALLRYSISTLACSMTFDISKAKKLLGYHPVMTIEEAIEEFISSQNNVS